MKKILFPLAILALFAVCQGAKAAGSVTICDIVNVGYCAQVDSSGRLSINGTFSATVATIVVSTTDKSGTIVLGGTAQSAIASNASRKGWCIQNPASATEDLFVRVNGTASATTGTDLSPGMQTCSSPSMVDQAAVSVFAATTSHAYLGFEVQ